MGEPTQVSVPIYLMEGGDEAALCAYCKRGWVSYSVTDPEAPPEPLSASPHHFSDLHGPAHHDCCDEEYRDCPCATCRSFEEQRWGTRGTIGAYPWA